MFLAKRSRIKKHFKKKFGVEITNEEVDKFINLTRQHKHEEVSEFIEQILEKAGENDALN